MWGIFESKKEGNFSMNGLINLIYLKLILPRRFKSHTLFLPLMGTAYLFLVTPAYPYSYGITPSGASSSDATSFYDTFKSNYYISCSGNIMVANSVGGGTCVSEGQGYAFLMTAYLEPDATGPALMKKLWNFVVAHMDSKNLMNWEVSCTGTDGANSATDGDMDMAEGLLEANKRWPGNGFDSCATTIINAILANETDSCGIGPGDASGFTSCSGYTYPSYFAMSYLTSFQCFTGNAAWATVKTNAYNQLNYWYTNYVLPPDQINMSNGSWNCCNYQYNSCRVPWRLSLDYLWNGNTNAYNMCKKILANFETQNPSPSTIGDGYVYNTGAENSTNHNAAFTGPAGDGAMVNGNADDQSYLNAEYTNLKSLATGSYYPDAHQVLSLMVQAGIFTDPCSNGTPTPTYTATNTPTNTVTHTPTNSPTNTITNTPTFTPTHTATGTATNTETNTITNTSTSTPTHTATNTVTNTPTNTVTNTITNTPTSSPTHTTTNTATNTATNAITNTATQTPTSTNTATNTATGTISTNTPINTPTNTLSPTATNTITNTQTNTSTSTVTHTPTNTATSTVTNTPTNTPTQTPTNTATHTPTSTATSTATNSPTNTSTNSVTNTPTSTPTFMVTNTPTATLSNTATNTLTPPPTSIHTNTPTITPTYIATTSPDLMISAPFPNPSNGSTITFNIEVPGESTVTMDIFTLAFRKIISQTSQVSSLATFEWALRDVSGVQVANGLYYVRIHVAGVQSTTKILKVLILR